MLYSFGFDIIRIKDKHWGPPSIVERRTVKRILLNFNLLDTHLI